MRYYIQKLGRWYHVFAANKQIGRRRSNTLALKLLLAHSFKPITKYHAPITGQIGKLTGARFISSL